MVFMQENRQESDTIQIVPTNQKYHYELMKQNIRELKRAYPFLEIKTAGYRNKIRKVDKWNQIKNPHDVNPYGDGHFVFP